MCNVDIKNEANRCLNCNNPRCVEGCPINMNIPKFINYIKNDKLDKAYEIITEKSCFGSICGRVCPHDKQCEGKCIRGIKEQPVQIGKLEAYVSDWGVQNKIKIPNLNDENKEINNKKVAIIGGGVAGLTCAAELKKLGYIIDIFEKEEKLRRNTYIWNTGV